MKTKVLLFLVSGLAFAAASSAQTVVLIEDTFTRVAGSLFGTSPESGLFRAGQWKQREGTANISASGAVIGGVNNEARIAFSATDNEIITAKADIVVGSGTTGWVGFGFTTDDATGTFYNQGSLWVTLNSSGTLVVYRNGTTSTQNKSWSSYAEATLGAFDANKTYTVTLSFNPETTRAKVWISDGVNEVSLLGDIAGAPDGWFPVTGVTASSLGAAGFRFNGNAPGNASLDNLLVTGGAVAVPEPANIAWLLGAFTLAALVVARARGSRSCRS